MRRRIPYLVAGMASLSLPFLAGSIAVGLGMGGPGGLTTAFLSFLVLPQIAPAICLAALYYDERRYRAYKPLTLAMLTASLALLGLCFFAAAKDPERALLAARSAESFGRQAIFLAADALVSLGVILALALTPSSTESLMSRTPPTQEELR